MINILNFAAVPFNSPVYERTERGKQALREEVMMEVARELQDLESDVSRILSRDSPFERQNQISRFPIGAKKKAPALTCLVVPGARETFEEDTRGCNGDNQEPCQPSRRKNPEGFRKVKVAASLICLLILFSLVKR